MTMAAAAVSSGNLLLATLFTILLSPATSPASCSAQDFARNLSKGEMRRLKRDHVTHLHFYFHDIVTGKNPTAVSVAAAAMTSTSKTLFGSVFMIDDPLTLGPESTSKIIGRAQGMYASASQEEVGLLMVMNFAFTEGKYSGSSLSVLGRNQASSAIREMPIAGGSGVFRLARGYAQARTQTFNLTTGNAVVEYDVFIRHH